MTTRTVLHPAFVRFQRLRRTEGLRSLARETCVSMAHVAQEAEQTR